MDKKIISLGITLFIVMLLVSGGHALFETVMWYSDSSSFVYLDAPCFFRGGYFSFGKNTGVWVGTYGYGGGDQFSSCRYSIIIE